MDPQVEQWQRQAQEAMQAQPERKDAIEAQLHEMITTLATTTWANQAQEAVDAGIPRQQVLDQYKGMLQEHGLAVSPESNFDEWFKQGRGPQFKNVKAGGDSTADPSFDVEYQANKFEDETPEEYFDRVERQGKQAARDTGVYAEQKAWDDGRKNLNQVERMASDVGGAAANIGAGILEGLGAATAIGANAVSRGQGDALVQEGMSDAGFDAQKNLNTMAETVRGWAPEYASDNAKLGGSIVSELAKFPVTGFQEGQKVIDEGGSVQDAELALGKHTAITELGLASGMLGSQAKGLIPLLTRQAAQIPTNVALGKLDSALRGEEYTEQQRNLDIGMGVLGGIFRNPQKPRVDTRFPDAPPLPPVPPGMEAFNAGRIASFDTPIDLNAPFVQKFDTIQRKAPNYGTIPETKVNVDGIETGRVDEVPLSREDLMAKAADSVGSKEAKATQRELAAHTKEAREIQGELDGLPDKKTLAREIEDEYLEEDLRVHGEEGAFSPELTKLRQDSADAEAGRQLEEKKSTLSSQLESVSDRLQRTESEAARQAEGQAALDKLRAVERRDGKPAPAPLAPEIPDVSGVASKTAFPSQEGVSMSVTEQPKVSYPIQGKNVPLVKKQPVTTAGITTPPIGSKAAAAADTPVVTRETVQEKIDRLKKGESLPPQLSSLVLEDGTTVSESVPKHVQDKLQAGTLTAREVLDSSAPALDTDAPAVKEAKNLITWLKATAERIGGEKVVLNIFDANDAHHLEMAPRNEKGELDNFAAFYSPADNRIYVKRGAGQAPTLVHEVAHGILSKLLHMGSEGQLKGPAAKAYADVSGTFNFLLKPELEKRAGPRPEGGTAKEKLDHAMKTYGLSDKDGKLDEMVSELFSNSKFRQTLKDIKLDPQTLSSLPPLAQGWAKKATNMYELIVRGLSRMMAHAGIRSYADMGMADKATNGYDLMFAQIDRLASSVSDADAAALKDYSTRNTTPDIQEISGLGEQVERRSLPKQSMEEKSTLVKPMSGKMAKLKSMFLAKGTEPTLTKRQEFLSGAKKEIKANKTALSNRATSIVSSMGEGQYASLIPHLDTFLSDSSMTTVTSRNAFNEISKASPELAKLYKDLTDKRLGSEHGGSVGLAQSLVDSQAGRKVPNELVLNLANKVIDNAYSFTPRTYQGREATRAKWKLAEAGQKKLEAGKLLSNKEETAVREQNALLGYVADNVFGNKESLKTLSFDALHDLYVQRFSADQYATLKGLSNKDKRQRMVVEVAEANAALGNRPAAIKEYAAKIADMGDEADKISKNYAQLKYGSGTLGTIDDVPKPIRDFWGELHDPTARLIEAVTKQDTHLAEVKSLQTLREEGLGTLFAKEEGQGMTEKLSGSKYGALEDLHTTPHIKEMIDTIVEMRPDRSMFDMWADLAPAMSIPLRAIRLGKTSATVYRPDALVRNAIGSFAQLYSNGNVNPVKQAQYGYRGLKAAASLMGMSHRKGVADDAALLLRLDLAEASTIADTYSPSARLAVDKLLQAVGENPESSVTFLRKLGNLADSGNTLAKELYGSADIWTKFGNFFYELDAQKAYNDARGIKMTEKALQEQVADRIKQTNITPSRSPRWIQAVEAPGGTTYMGYYYETARTSANNLLYGLGDIKKGLADIKDGHGKAGAMMLNHGIKRVVGVVGAVGFTGAAYTGIAKAVLAGLGISASVAGDNEELKKYMEDDGFQDPDTTLVTKDSKTGKDYGIDVGSINPYEPIWSIIKPLGEAIANPSEGLEGVGKGVDKALGLISASSVLKGAQKAWNGTKPYLEKSDPELYTNLQQRGVDAGLSPATVDRLINVLFPVTPGGLKDSAKRSFMDTDDTTKELTHVGARELNPAKDIRSFLGRSFTWDLKKAKDNYAQWLTTPATITPTQLEKGFKDAMDDIAKPYKKLSNAVNAGVSMGKTEDELYASLKSANVDKETIGSILEDEVYPARLVYSDMKSLMRKQLDNELDEDKRDALADKWDVKMEMLQDILEKYEDLTLEQLEQGASRAK